MLKSVEDIPPVAVSCTLHNIRMKQWKKCGSRKFCDLIRDRVCQMLLFGYDFAERRFSIDILISQVDDINVVASARDVLILGHLADVARTRIECIESPLQTTGASDCRSLFNEIIQVGKFGLCFMAHFESPDDFHIMPVTLVGENRETFNSIVDMMKSLYANHTKRKEGLHRPQVGQYHVFKDGLNRYHRVKTIGNPKAEMAEIFLLDRGRTLVTKARNLFPMFDLLKEKPRLAVAAKLHGVAPMDFIGGFKNDTLKFLEKMLMKPKILRYEVMSVVAGKVASVKLNAVDVATGDVFARSINLEFVRLSEDAVLSKN